MLTGPLAQSGHVATGMHGITAGLVGMPSATAGSLALAACLLLYAVGLLMPLRERTRP